MSPTLPRLKGLQWRVEPKVDVVVCIPLFMCVFLLIMLSQAVAGRKRIRVGGERRMQAIALLGVEVKDALLIAAAAS